eukprot:652437-Prorocentrum_minimum.AAC.3
MNGVEYRQSMGGRCAQYQLDHRCYPSARDEADWLWWFTWGRCGEGVRVICSVCGLRALTGVGIAEVEGGGAWGNNR